MIVNFIHETWPIFLIAAVVFIIFAVIRLAQIERGRRAIVSMAWRREQLREQAYLAQERREEKDEDDAADDDTKTLPPGAFA